MPLPKPKHGENEQDYINRCVNFIFDEGTLNGKPMNPESEDDRKQATAACYTQWKNRNKSKTQRKQKKVLRYLKAAEWRVPRELDMSTNDGINLIRSTVLVGDGTYNGEFFPAEEIEKAYKSMDNQPFNLDHSDKVEDEIGYVKNTRYDPTTKKMSVQPVINGRLRKAQIAKDYIDNRRMAGRYAEVSVGVYVTPVEEELDDGEKRIVCRDLEFDHLALVTRGACSPADGAGIGLGKNNNPDKYNTDDSFDEDDNMDEKEFAKWDTKFINDLPDAAFAYIEPGGKKDETGRTVPRSLRHFPHHNMSVKKGSEHNTVDKPHLRNALARAPQSPFGKKALPHLIRHAKALGIGKYSKDVENTYKQYLINRIKILKNT